MKYNQEITLKELENAIESINTKNSSSFDLISNKIIKLFTTNQKQELLNLFNASLKLGFVPNDWKIAKIILILKKNNDPELPSAYRPISLISNIGKLLERIICQRLTDWAESKKILIDEQAGFRRGRSTQNVLFKLIESTAQMMKNKQKTGLVLFDFAKAFDTIPHSEILKTLNKIRCPSIIGKWLLSYLENRKFKIAQGVHTSTEKNIASGVPQGGCLSALLFAIFINDLGTKLKKLSPKLNYALFADDLSIWCSNTRIRSINTILQKATKIIHKFALRKGLKINTNKCCYTVFARNYNKPTYHFNSNLSLQLENTQIKKSLNPVLLGIKLDTGLTFAEHFNEVKMKCEAKINLIKILSSKAYSIHPKYLLTIYKAFILSLIQYSMLPYMISSNKIKNDLQAIQNRAIRIIFKLHKATPVKILNSLANMDTLENRLKKLTLKFLLKAQEISPEIKLIISNFDVKLKNKKSILYQMNI